MPRRRASGSTKADFHLRALKKPWVKEYAEAIARPSDVALLDVEGRGVGQEQVVDLESAGRHLERVVGARAETAHDQAIEARATAETAVSTSLQLVDPHRSDRIGLGFGIVVDRVAAAGEIDPHDRETQAGPVTGQAHVQPRRTRCASCARVGQARSQRGEPARRPRAATPPRSSGRRYGRFARPRDRAAADNPVSRPAVGSSIVSSLLSITVSTAFRPRSRRRRPSECGRVEPIRDACRIGHGSTERYSLSVMKSS